MNIGQVLRNKDYTTLPIITEKLRAVFQLENEKLMGTGISALPVRNMYRMHDCSKPTHLPLKRERDSGVLTENQVRIRRSCQSALIGDTMRCRKKDGRRWRCRDEVVRPGAALCRYHTQKISEKRGRKASENSPSGPPGVAQNGQNDVEACSQDSEVSLDYMFHSGCKSSYRRNKQDACPHAAASWVQCKSAVRDRQTGRYCRSEWKFRC
ncbi:hypothetical protein KP509_1Z181800 [Ceratopteris richardii]|nr:hypothetical protein KP509_1Z181800 [Ceratopteris richardii]